MGLAKALESLTSDFASRTGIDVDVKVSPIGRDLSPDAKTTLYRVAQEALTNIERHAGATRASISLDAGRRAVVLGISDNGCGFNPSRTTGFDGRQTGIGMKNMRERIERFDGNFHVRSTPAGTQIEARLPRATAPGQAVEGSRMMTKAETGRAVFDDGGDRPIRILLADDHPLVLEGVRSCLEIFDHIAVIGAVTNGAEALDEAKRLQPDIVLLDINMPMLNGIDASRAFRAELPDVKVLILSMHDNKEYVTTAIQLGARGYVLKDVPTRELVTAIEAIHNGGLYFSSGISALITAASSNDSRDETPLTDRESSVLRLLAEGKSNKEVARELDISVRTAETHRKNIKRKLGISTTAGLTRYAMANDLRDDEVTG